MPSIGTRQRQNFVTIGEQPSGQINSSYTRDVGMTKRLAGVGIEFDQATGTVVAGGGQMDRFAAGDVLALRGSNLNNGCIQAQSAANATIVTWHGVKDEPPVIGEIRTP